MIKILQLINTSKEDELEASSDFVGAWYKFYVAVLLLKSLFCGLPVDNIPDRREIFGFPVLVLQAVMLLAPAPVYNEKLIAFDEGYVLIGMLPRIDPQQWYELSHNRVLVLSDLSQWSALPMRSDKTHSISLHANPPRLLILNQPSPATPLNPGQLRIHNLLQLLYPSKRLLDLLAQRSTGRLPTTLVLRRQILPEQSVVDVPPTVEVYEGLESDGLLDVGGAVGGEGGCLLGEVVEAVHVGGVVFGVVELHYLARNGGFEGGVVV